MKTGYHSDGMWRGRLARICMVKTTGMIELAPNSEFVVEALETLKKRKKVP